MKNRNGWNRKDGTEGLTKKKEKGMYPRRGGGIFLPFFRTAAEIREPYRFDAGVHDREPHRFTAGVHGREPHRFAAGVHGREPHRFAAAVHGSAHCCRSPDRLGDAKEWLLEQITVCIAALTGDRADSCRTWQTATGVRGLLRAAAAILRVLLTIAALLTAVLRPRVLSVAALTAGRAGFDSGALTEIIAAGGNFIGLQREQGRSDNLQMDARRQHKIRVENQGNRFRTSGGTGCIDSQGRVHKHAAGMKVEKQRR